MDEKRIDSNKTIKGQIAQYPIWIQILYDKGFTLLFAIAALGALYVWGERAINAHLAYISSQGMQMHQQTEQMKLQTNYLSEIVKSNHQQELNWQELRAVIHSK